LAAYAACLLSKTAAALLPAVLVVLDWARGRRLGRRELLRLVPFFALGGALSVVTVLYERYRNGADPAFALPWIQRPLLAGRVFWFYLGKLAVPVDPSFVYRRWPLDPSSALQWAPLAAAAALGVVLWRARRRFGRAPFAAFAAYGLLLFPVLGLFDVFFMRFSFVADHFAYFAAIPALALVPALVERLVRPAAARRALLGAAVLACAAATAARVPAFRDAETLWRATLEKNPASWMAWDNLAVEELARGAWAQAAEHADRAVALLPGFGVAWFHLGVARWNAGDHAGAAEAFDRSLGVDPRYRAAAGPRLALAQTYLGMRELELGRPAAAVERLRAAADAYPERAASWFNLARALLESKRRAEAAPACARGLALAPDSPDGAQCRALGARR
ncbi:MAG: tetratricopeptide repeat protein, partial [Elusimicrobia bacterium]|nr:tetratricopeptide repeat protein [Elusimicrobiota bacterium]